MKPLQKLLVIRRVDRRMFSGLMKVRDGFQARFSTDTAISGERHCLGTSDSG